MLLARISPQETEAEVGDWPGEEPEVYSPADSPTVLLRPEADAVPSAPPGLPGLEANNAAAAAAGPKANTPSHADDARATLGRQVMELCEKTTKQRSLMQYCQMQVQKEKEKTMELLVSIPPEALKVKDSNGHNVLHHAVQNGWDAVVERLCYLAPELANEVTTACPVSSTALQMVAQAGPGMLVPARLNIVQHLLRVMRPKMVQARNSHGKNALHLACATAHVDVIGAVANSGLIDVSVRDKKGKRPIDFANLRMHRPDSTIYWYLSRCPGGHR